jgi:hypothetical protein
VYAESQYCTTIATGSYGVWNCCNPDSCYLESACVDFSLWLVKSCFRVEQTILTRVQFKQLLHDGLHVHNWNLAFALHVLRHPLNNIHGLHI